MELNDKVKYILTQKGADVINKENKEMRELIGKDTAPYLRTDYKEGDVYCTQLWDLFMMFGPYTCAGAEILFTDLELNNLK